MLDNDYELELITAKFCY